MSAKNTTWVGGAVFGAVVILAAGWTFAISPAMTRADDAQTETTSVEGHNTALQRTLKKLKSQYENIDASKRDVAAIETQIPTTAQLADYLREVAAVTDASGAFIVSISPGVPVTVVPAEVTGSEAPAPTDTTTESPSDGSTTAPTESPSDAAPADASASAGTGIAGFVAVPVDITLLGHVGNVTSALASLQSSTSRLFLVTAMTGKGTDAKEASEGKPATAKGDLELTISGYIYVLQDTTASAPSDTPTTPGPLPQGDGSGALTKGA